MRPGHTRLNKEKGKTGAHEVLGVSRPEGKEERKGKGAKKGRRKWRTECKW